MSAHAADAVLERVLAAPELEADTALIAIADRFAGCEATLVQERLDDAARPLFGAASKPMRRQAERLAELLTNGLALRPATGDHHALLVDRALTERTAHPLVIAAIGHEVARRAGLRSHVCCARGHWWLALSDDETLMLVGCSPDAQVGEAPVRAACPHQIAFALLAQLHHEGPPDWHARAAHLMHRIPLVAHDDE